MDVGGGLTALDQVKSGDEEVPTGPLRKQNVTRKNRQQGTYHLYLLSFVVTSLNNNLCFLS